MDDKNGNHIFPPRIGGAFTDAAGTIPAINDGDKVASLRTNQPATSPSEPSRSVTLDRIDDVHNSLADQIADLNATIAEMLVGKLKPASTEPSKATAAPITLWGVRLVDVLALAIFGLGVYQAFKNGTPLPTPPVIQPTTSVVEFKGLPVGTTVTTLPAAK